jgi:DNA-binding HxlR family transcriptional regulator
MRHEDLLGENCPIARTGAVLGERWMIAILRAAYFRARTFEDYQRQTGIARNILSDRLHRLVDFRILERRAYAEGEKRTLSEYRLTEAGLDLYPIIVAMLEWGNKHTGLVHGAPTELVHRPCGKVTHARMVCSECGQEIDPHDIEVLPGPGAATRAPAWTPAS